MKTKYSDQKTMGHSQSSSKRKFIAMQIYLRKQEKLQINNAALHLKELEKEEQNPKWADGKKS